MRGKRIWLAGAGLGALVVGLASAPPPAAATGINIVINSGATINGGVLAIATGTTTVTVTNNGTVNNTPGDAISITAQQGAVLVTNNGALNGAGGGVVATTSSPTGVTFVDTGSIASSGGVGMAAVDLATGTASITTGAGAAGSPLVTTAATTGMAAESVAGAAIVNVGAYNTVTAGAPGAAGNADVAAVAIDTTFNPGGHPAAQVAVGANGAFALQGNNSAAITAHTGMAGGGGPNGTASAVVNVANGVAVHVSGYSDAGVLGYVADPSGEGTFAGSGNVSVTVGTGSILMDEVGASGTPTGSNTSAGVGAISGGGNVLIDNSAQITVTGGVSASVGLVTATSGSGTSLINSRAGIVSENGDGIRATTANGANTVDIFGGDVAATNGDGVNAAATGAGNVTVTTALGSIVTSAGPGAFAGISATSVSGNVAVTTGGVIGDGGILASSAGAGSVSVINNAPVTNSHGVGVTASSSGGSASVVANGVIFASGSAILAETSGAGAASATVNQAVVSLSGVGVEANDVGTGPATVTTASGTSHQPLAVTAAGGDGLLAVDFFGPAVVNLGSYNNISATSASGAGSGVVALALLTPVDSGGPSASVVAGTHDNITVNGNQSSAIAALVGLAGEIGPNGSASAQINIGNNFNAHVSGYNAAGVFGAVTDYLAGDYVGAGAVSVTVGTGTILVDEVGAVGAPTGNATSVGVAAISGGGKVLIDDSAQVTVTGGLDTSIGLDAVTGGTGISVVNARASVTTGHGDGVLSASGSGGSTVDVLNGKISATGGDGVDARASGSGTVFVTTSAGTDVKSLSPGAFSGISATAAGGDAAVTTAGTVSDGGIVATTAGSGTVLVQTGAAVTDTNGDAIRTSTAAGSNSINVTAGKVTATNGDGIDAASGTGAINIDTLAGTTVKSLTPGTFAGISAISGSGSVTIATLGNVADGGVRASTGGAGNVSLVAGGTVTNTAGDAMEGSADNGTVAVENTGAVNGSAGGMFAQRVGPGSGTAYVQASGNVTAGTGAALEALNTGQGPADALIDSDVTVRSAGGTGALAVAVGGQAISFIGQTGSVTVGAPGAGPIAAASAISYAFTDSGGPSAQAYVSGGSTLVVKGNVSAGAAASNQLPTPYGGFGGSSVTVEDGVSITVHGLNDAGLFASNVDTTGAGAYATAGNATVVAGADTITVNESGAVGSVTGLKYNVGIGALSNGGNVTVTSAAAVSVSGGLDSTIGIVTSTTGGGASAIYSTGAVTSKQGDGIKATTVNGANVVTLAAGSVSAPNGSAINAISSGAGLVKITVGAGVTVTGQNGVSGTSAGGLLAMSNSGTITAGGGGFGVLFSSPTTMALDNQAGGDITGAGSSTAVEAGGGGLFTLANQGTLGGTKSQPNGAAVTDTSSGGMDLDNAAGAVLNGIITGADHVTFTNEGTWDTRGTSDFGTAAGAPTNTLTNTGLIQVGDNAPAAAATNSAFSDLGAFNNGSATANGVISMVNGHEGDVLTINAPFVAATGHSFLGLDAFLGGPGSKADQLHLTMGSTGQTLIDITDTNPGLGALNSKGIVLVTGQTSFSDFSLDPSQPNYDPAAHGIDKGLFVYVLSNVKGAEALVGLPGPGAAQLAAMGGAVAQVWSSSTPGSDQEAGLMSAFVSNDGDESDSNGPRVWSKALNWGASRLNGGQTQLGAGFGGMVDTGQPVAALSGVSSGALQVSSGGASLNLNAGYAQNTSSLTTGVDLGRHVGQSSAWAWGVSGGYVESEQSFTSGTAPALYSGAMATVQGAYIRGGFYLDGDIKVDVLNASFLGPWQGASRQGSTAASFGLEGEAGYHVALNANWSLEPLASLSAERTSLTGMSFDGTAVSFPGADTLKVSVGAKFAADYAVRGYHITGSATARVWDELGTADGLAFDGVASNLVPFGPGDGTLGDLAASVNVSKLSGHTSAFVSTAYQFNSSYKAESVLAGFKLAW
jgi:hypothetical protein